MAYTFSGFFLNLSANRLGEVLAITGGTGREVRADVPCLALSLRGEYDFGEPVNPLTFSLLDWTRSNPEVTVVYAFVECNGGNCDQAGFVARNGAIVHVEPRTEAFERLEAPLDRLLRYLGITLQGGYFEPLTRDYFQSLS